ncbi:MAG TPA: zinc ribbon domain-containing protein, partial [Armatimonadota bacterium]|nr:zinc ribbon domain-containing protein [Armatimonadota bacterium]
CPVCGAESEDSARFCRSCGKPLTSAAPGGSAPARVAAYVLLVVTVAVAAVLWARGGSGGQEARPATPSDVARGVVAPPVAAAPEGEAAPAPEPVDDPLAEARVVLEKYLAADLRHDGREMAKYLGGQAAARFNSEVQGQEDITIHSKVITGGDTRDENTVEFIVRVEWSPSDSYEVQNDEQGYVLRRTEEGWRVFSTPEYPE